VLWTPAELTDVAVWLDASEGSSLTLDGTAVAQWSDRSGSGNHAVQATAGSRPTYNAAAVGIDTTTSTFLGFPQQLLGGTTAASIYLVGNQTAGGAGWGRISVTDGNQHTPWTNGHLYSSFASNSRPGSPTALVHPYANVATLLGFEQTGTAMQYWQTGNSLGSTGATYAIPAAGATSQRLGAMYTGAYRHHEIVLVRRVLSEADRQRLEGYLAHKWGLQAQLPANHPYKAAPPTVP
jgi:hypothetical protein